MRPLAAMVGVCVALGAPLAYLHFGLRARCAQASAEAARIAFRVRQEGLSQDGLWRYGAPKLVEHLQAFHLGSAERIRIVDRFGLVFTAGEEPQGATVWGRAALLLADDSQSAVWVGLGARDVIVDGLVLLLVFAAVGAGLALLVTRLPVRSMERAGERILVLMGQSELARRAADLQEQERRRLARELHDGVGQALTGLRIHLQLAEHGDGKVLERAKGMVDDAIEEVRRSVADLGPSILDEIGLLEALRRYTLDFSERTGIPVELDLPAGDARLPTSLESACYRIVQEALSNTAKHAGASRVCLRVQIVSEHLRLEVSDDGQGFEPGAVDGQGLCNIAQRVSLQGGCLEIDTAPGRGCALRAELPLDVEGT